MNKTRQIIIIHGGDTFDHYEAYLDFLKNFSVDKDIFTKKNWKQSLAFELGETYEVIRPEMPCKWNAKYLEWQIWFEKLVPLFAPEAIFIGHSLGGLFLVKYLSENHYPKKITALMLVAAPYDMVDLGESLADFNLPSSLALLTKQCQKLYLYHSHDDPVVPFKEMEKYQTALTAVEVSGVTEINIKSLDQRGHCNQVSFPELSKDILAL